MLGRTHAHWGAQGRNEWMRGGRGAFGSRAGTCRAPTGRRAPRTGLRHVEPLAAEGYVTEGRDRFAVISLLGSQYKVTRDDVLTANKVVKAEVGTTLTLDDVLLVGGLDETVVGAPFVQGARVHLAVEEQKKDKKVLVLKKKRRKGYQRKNGTRRHITVLRVLDIELP